MDTFLASSLSYAPKIAAAENPPIIPPIKDPRIGIGINAWPTTALPTVIPILAPVLATTPVIILAFVELLSSLFLCKSDIALIPTTQASAIATFGTVPNKMLIVNDPPVLIINLLDKVEKSSLPSTSL